MILKRYHRAHQTRRPLAVLFHVVFLLVWAISGANAARVAVFSQTGFPFYGPPALTSPRRIARDLRTAGVPADLLNAVAVADSARLNIRTYDAVVLPYGNTYPQNAFANLRAFHRAGGCLIVSGIPFTHAVAQGEDGSGREAWRDLGHDGEPAGFGPAGIGVGGFGAESRTAAKTGPGDPLGLKSVAPNWPGTAQTLDTRSFPAQSRVLPILTADGKPIAALIVHNADGFDGAVDARLNFPHPADVIQDTYEAEQLMTRGTLAALAVKGALTNDQKRRGFAALTKQRPAPPVYANLTLPAPPRPYPTLQPKSAPPARHLYVADVRRLDHDARRLLTSLQGLVNRRQPRVYLIFKDEDAFWLEYMQKKGYTDAPIAVADPFSLLQTFRSAYKGVVLPDPKVSVSLNVAVNFAGADDLLLATPALASRFRLPVKADLRGRFGSNVEAMRFVRTTLLPRLNPYLGAVLSPKILGDELDLIIEKKGICFWATGAAEQDEPGADGLAETIELEALLARMPLGAIIRGYPWAGDGYGLGEHPGVTLFSRFGKILTASDYVTNWSVMSGIRLRALKQKPQPPAPKLDTGKVYLAVTLSDGDNLGIWRGVYHDSLADPLHGTIPVGYGMGPTLIDCAPLEAQWAYEHMAPTDEFICDVSGAGYIYPADWGETLKNRDAARRRFFTDWTQDYMKRLDMKGLRVMGLDARDIARVGRETPNAPFLMPDYGWAGAQSLDELSYTLPTGQPVFRAVSYGPEGHRLANEVRSRVGSARPAFVNAFVFLWGFHLSYLKQMMDDLGPDYVAVTPTQLNALYRQAARRQNAAH